MVARHGCRAMAMDSFVTSGPDEIVAVATNVLGQAIRRSTFSLACKTNVLYCRVAVIAPAVIVDRDLPGSNAAERYPRSDELPNSPDGCRRLSSLELFTGAGGMALGTHRAGFRHIGLIEWNRDACATLRANVSAGALPAIADWHVFEGDARALIPSIAREFSGSLDLIAGGPPCQPFSIAGKHRGMDDPRNMIPAFIDAVRRFRPRAFLMENVRGFARPDFADYLQYITKQLRFPDLAPEPGEDWRVHNARLDDSLDRRSTDGDPAGGGYRVQVHSINAADYGVPQIRHRVFLVGLRTDVPGNWSFPQPTHSRQALIADQLTGAYWARHGMRRPPGFATERGAITVPIGPDGRRSRPWRTVRDAIAGLPEPRPDGAAPRYANHHFIPGARSYVGHTGSELDSPAKTFKAGDHGVPGGENTLRLPDGQVRYFTVRETARIQRFPDGWRFEGPWGEIMRQLGNAVPVRLAHVVANSLARVLTADRQ
jgi:DNA (cytosine-5)-methyltransferase 1